MIPIEAIEDTAFELMQRAAIVIPDDYKSGIEAMLGEEQAELSRFVLQAMIENWQAAEEDRRAMCADTGLPRYFVKVGNEARIEGGFVALETALRRATAAATQAIPLRPNRVHPLSRADHNNNVGILAPEIDPHGPPRMHRVDLREQMPYTMMANAWATMFSKGDDLIQVTGAPRFAPCRSSCAPARGRSTTAARSTARAPTPAPDRGAGSCSTTWARTRGASASWAVTSADAS